MDTLTDFMTAYNDGMDAALDGDRTFAFTALKTFNGRDGQGYSATVTRNGTKVGEVVDEGNGGAPFLHVSQADRDAFIAEAQMFFPGEAWSAMESYCAALEVAASINRKRAVIVATSTKGQRLGDGVYLAITGGEKDYARVAAYLLSAKSGVAEVNPRIWVKAESRFVPAAAFA